MVSSRFWRAEAEIAPSKALSLDGPKILHINLFLLDGEI